MASARGRFRRLLREPGDARRERRRARQRALRYPDFYTDDRGEVHPIRDSPGYSELEERARGRERQRAEDYAEYESRATLAHQEHAYRELVSAILSEGGLRPDPDYPAEDIPLGVKRLRGTAPDEMPLKLVGHGYHFDDAEDMLDNLRRRRRNLEAAGILERA